MESIEDTEDTEGEIRPFEPNYVSAPGDTIIDCLENMGKSLEEFTKEIGLSKEDVDLLIVGKLEIDKALAQKLAIIIGSTENFWIKRDLQYRKGKKRLGITD